MQYHPAFTNKPVRLALTDDSKVLITYDTGEVYPYDWSVEMNTDEASLLHYLLTQFLFDPKRPCAKKTIFFSFTPFPRNSM